MKCENVPLLMTLASLGWALVFSLTGVLLVMPRRRTPPAAPVDPGEPPLEDYVHAPKRTMGGP